MNIVINLTKAVLKDFANSDSSMESMQKVILKYFANNQYAEYTENGNTIKMTYKDVFDRAQGAANNILSKTKQHRDGVCILKMSNHINWIIAFWGIIQSGIKPILVDPGIDEKVYKEITKQLKIVLIIDDKNINEYLKDNVNNHHVTWAKEVAFLSSGTTDVPKIITYDCVAFKSQIMVATWVLGKNKNIRIGNQMKDIDTIRILAFLPFYHIFGFMVIAIWFSFFGRTLVFADSISSESIQFACKKHHVTHFFAVPILWENVVNKIVNESKKQGQEKRLQRAIKLSNNLQTLFPKFGTWFARSVMFKKVREQALGNTLVFLISGGALINEKYLRMLNGLGYSIHNGYGLTESGIVSVELSKKANKRNLTSVGIPFPNVLWRKTDDGTLEIKSDLVYKSQLHHGVTTSFNKDDWYDTKDAIEVNKGRLQIIGRIDDAIIGSDGNNVYPESLENIYNTSVLYTVGILGLKQRSGSHRINLLVKFDEHITPTAKQAIINRIYKTTEQIPLHKRPTKFFEVDQIPLTQLGKVKHRELLGLYDSGKLILNPINIKSDKKNTDTNKLDKDLLLIVRQCFAKAFEVDVKDIHDDTDFITDLGGSSIDYYTILNEINHATGKEIKLIGNKILITPIDFTIYLMQTYN